MSDRMNWSVMRDRRMAEPGAAEAYDVELTYASLKETAYLMASPANAHRLNEAVEELRNGGGETHDLIHPDARR
ncbi:hypothetical protein [Micromonospora inyonensis]|uniref:Antitoxin YefM n=1 Tax=Micromonospora inyonensis TaxID=47866 RepID=A0A1C6REC9_9ACTN|nr:hypothetical protein [Micromonospora inyonensis]SCL15509.1 hypothetical protein GA0074694_1246 [Micromonospora inyonensis]